MNEGRADDEFVAWENPNTAHLRLGAFVIRKFGFRHFMFGPRSALISLLKRH
jgi:hypothetical protein